MNRRELPIFELEEEIVSTFQRENRLILQAPTGSGKSTQVPQILLDRGFLEVGSVVVLQPRRLATRLLAARVAQERRTKLGAEVGYQIRFENITSAATRIRFVTEGVLLRQLIEDPTLRGVAAILFDEFHERHLYGDITLARALELQRTERPELKLAVMSATLESALLQQFLAPTALLTSSGRQHPVHVEYLAKQVRADDYPVWDLAADELGRIAAETEGDVLIFMPGKFEITRTLSAISASRVSSKFIALPLHGELPPREQDAALVRYEKRKAIVATNVAETSLTIEGIRTVIDSGLARIGRFDARRGINTLLVEKISCASADQRAGRAGRTAPGYCLRLWTEIEHRERPAQELPEVKRLDLAEVVLTLKASGVEDLTSFRWLEPPEAHALARAERLLSDLGAIGLHTGRISTVGARMLSFPVHPRYARMLLTAQEQRCVRTIALIAALTQGRPLLRRLENKQAREDREDILAAETRSDLLTLVRAFSFAERNNFNPQRCARLGVNAAAAREAAQLWEQFLEIARRQGLNVESAEAAPDALERCLLAGFPDQVATRYDQGTLRCALVHHRRGVLARESVVRDAPLLVASEIREIETAGRDREVLLTLATAIRKEWLRELFPEACQETNELAFDETGRRVMRRERIAYHDLVLEEKLAPAEGGPETAALLAREVEAGSCPLKNWNNEVEQWIARLNFVAGRLPDYQLPPLRADDRGLLTEQICAGAATYKEVKDRPVWPIVRAWLSPRQQELLDELAPERLKLPKGRLAKVTYHSTHGPTLAARIQDLYGVEENLKIGRGQIPVRLEVLAPNHRPIQVTENLVGFWRETYPKLKRELQRKYPKHEWR